MSNPIRGPTEFEKPSDYSSPSVESRKSDSISLRNEHPTINDQTLFTEKNGSVNTTSQAEEPKRKRTVSNVLTRVISSATSKSIPEPPPPPDGGLKAWTQVAMGWIVIFTTWGWVNSYGAFQTYYTLNLSESASTISWIGAIQNWFTFFLAAFSGRLLDAGLFLPTLVVGASIQIIGIFTMSVSTKFWQLMLTQGICTGLGGGIFFTPALGLVGTYFAKRRALAIGIASTGNSAGGMIYPVLVQQLLPKLGFAWTVRVLGFLNLGCLSLVLALMRPRLPPRRSGPIVDVSAFREPPYAYYVAGLFFVIWPGYYTFYYLSSFANEVIGLPFSTSTMIVILLNGVGMPARVIIPFFADRFGQLNVFTPVLITLTIVAFCWLGVNSTGGIWVFTCFYGLASAAFQCLIPSTVASLTPEMNMFGTRLGMAFSTLSFAALTGPPIGGALQGAEHGKFLGANLWAAVSTSLCAGLVLAARVAKGGWKLNVKC